MLGVAILEFLIIYACQRSIGDNNGANSSRSRGWRFVLSDIFFYTYIFVFKMDPGDQRITLDDFSHWKIEALRSFLSCRGLSTTGNKQELVAFAFANRT